MNYNSQNNKNLAVKFIVLLGFVSFFSDMTYQSFRSITGPYLAILGASATTVGVVAGFGELIGYALRFLTGFISDKTKRYWDITILGYAMNLIAIPLMALAGNWQTAAGLILLERIGKAIRIPPRDAMLSYAASEIGTGKGFGMHKFIDQIGGILGPLLITVILFVKGGYKLSFALLAIPSLITVWLLFKARNLYPQPADLQNSAPKIETKGFSKIFWLYLVGVSFIAAGYADFPLIAYHFKKLSIASDIWIPALYAVAMGVGAFSSLLFGILFDKIGSKTLVVSVGFSAFFAIAAFSGNFYLIILGVILWGIGIGAQESIMKAAVAELVPSNKRGSAYGVFNTGYGISWFLGSALMGVLYDYSIPLLVGFSVLAQLISIPFFFLISKKAKI